MECDGIILEVFVNSDHLVRTSFLEEKGLRHIAFTVDSIEEIKVEIESIKMDFFGRRFIFTKNPDGQSIEIKEKYEAS